MTSRRIDGPPGAGLGTFAGVFTPSVLTILGIILFLRTGFVVGNAGLRGALIVMGIATTVSVLTSISLAAIATNLEVRGGGDYYLISRTLGRRFGGAIGIVLFLAQSVSVAFYAIGFGEAIGSIAGWDGRLPIQLVALAAVAVLFNFAWAGADVAARFQYVVMALLVGALLSFYVGAIIDYDPALMADSWTAPAGALGFWAVFAIFFPAVTGFTQGVSMSGDLADPGRSLSRGTFLAVGVSTVVYVTVALLLVSGVPLTELVDDDGTAMRSLAAVGALVSAGVVAATLSSAMASMLGAPRIMQSMAADRVFPFIDGLAKGSGASNNPRRALLVSLVIAVVTIGLGSVDLIAPVVSMFFLISYGLLNYATYYEARAGSPAFRPRFRYFHKWVSLAGAWLCGGAMLAINPIAGAASILLLFAVYQALGRRTQPELWADAAHSHHFRRAVEHIRALESTVDHPRNWRPQILVFSADRLRRERLLRFAKWIEGDSGVTAAFRIVVGEGARKRLEADEIEAELRSEISALGLHVHGRAILAADGMEALPVIVQSFGLGYFDANLVLFGWPETPEPERLDSYVRALRGVARLGVSVLCLSTDADRWERLGEMRPKARSVHVWWADNDSGRLAVMAAYLSTRHDMWRRASIRVIAAGEGDPDGTRDEIVATLHNVRIEAEVDVIDGLHHDDFVASCATAPLVLVPMRIRNGRLLDPLGGDMLDLAVRLPMTAAVLAGAPIHLDTDPETDLAAQLAVARTQAAEARQRLGRLEDQLEEAMARVDTLRQAGSGEELAKAEAQREEVLRRTLTARARVERTQRDLDHVLAEGS
jgi:amino acid transporter